VTIVADGNTATEIHLGFLHGEGEEKTARSDADRTNKTGGRETPERTARKATPPPEDNVPQSGVEKTTRGKAASHPKDEDDELEVPGKVKRYEPTRHILVVTLLNGKDRSFLLSRDVKVLVKGAASKEGLEDPALKVGASIEVVTDEGGHKVKELKIIPPSPRRKAG
jgi:hypothetical protein